MPPATIARSPLLAHANTHCPAKDAVPSTDTTPPVAETDKEDPSPRGGGVQGGGGRHIHTHSPQEHAAVAITHTHTHTHATCTRTKHTHTHTPRAHVPNTMVPSGRMIRSPSKGPVGVMPGAVPALHSTVVTPSDSGHSRAVPAAAHTGARSLHHLFRSSPRTENRSRPEAVVGAGSAAEAAAAVAAARSAAEAARAALVGGEAVLEVSPRF